MGDYRVFLDDLAERARKDKDFLHRYWTKGPGLAKWVTSAHPWTTLVAHLTKHVGPGQGQGLRVPLVPRGVRVLQRK